MYVVIRVGNKQYKVSEGDTIFVEKIEGEKGKEIEISDVLLLRNEKGIQVGSPILQNVKVTAEIVDQGKEKKVLVGKFKSKIKYRRKKGHRQAYTKLRIKSIQTSE